MGVIPEETAIATANTDIPTVDTTVNRVTEVLSVEVLNEEPNPSERLIFHSKNGFVKGYKDSLNKAL